MTESGEEDPGVTIATKLEYEANNKRPREDDDPFGDGETQAKRSLNEEADAEDDAEAAEQEHGEKGAKTKRISTLKTISKTEKKLWNCRQILPNVKKISPREK